MNDIIITKEVIGTAIANNITKVLDDMFSRTYSNPVKDAIEAEIEKADSIIKDFVSGLIGQIMSDPEYQAQVKEMVMARLVEKALKS